VKNIKTSDLEAYKLVRIKTPVVKEINTKVPNESGGRKKHLIVKTRVETPRKIATINRELQLLRAIFRFALSDKIVSRSPFENHSIISTAAEVQRERVLSVEEEERLLEQCTDQRGHLRALVIAAVDTAMRFGELIKLKWNDVYMEQRTITLLATNTKTQKMRRIGMTPRVQEELQRLWEMSDQDNDSLVFGIKSTIKRSWKSACEAAVIEDFHFHDLRHTATTRLVFTGMSQVQAMKLTGHTQTKTFLRYTNPTDESIVAAADMLSDYNARQARERQSQTISALVN
jgi:integrase